ncbi:MAG: CTP:molybdopterin cytidylyltransferase [Prosthecobacter sp.]|nr:CTP:molybdopterin cytidylyltransferase [Prosthecobacter sp.]
MPRIGSIILAAGGSTRMGKPKQLLDLRGSALVCNAVRAAQEGGCDAVCVVTGHAREGVESALAGLRPQIVHNEHWQRGMGSSIRLGVSAIQPASAVILLTCDQPAVDSTVIRSLIERYEQSGRSIVASYYADTLGVPALFDQSCFAELHQLPDDRGAKSVIHADSMRVAFHDFPAGALDLDSPQDLCAWHNAAHTHPHERAAAISH